MQLSGGGGGDGGEGEGDGGEGDGGGGLGDGGGGLGEGGGSDGEGGGGLGEGGGGEGDGGGGLGEGDGGGGEGDGGGGEGGSEGGEGYAVIAMVLIMLHSADHSPANRSDCPAPMVTNCVETVNSLTIVDPDTGCMGPPLGPTVQPDDNGGASHRESPKPISTR